MNRLPPTSFKVEDPDLISLKVKEHLAFCTHDVGFSAVVVKTAHSKGSRGLVSKFHIDNLVINHIVVAFENTFSVLCIPQRIFYIRIGWVNLPC